MPCWTTRLASALALAAPATIASASLAAGDSSPYAGFSVVDLSDELGTPDGLVTYRVTAHFDDPDVYVVGGGTDGQYRKEFIVVTSDPEGIRNFGGILAGTDLEDFPGAPFSDPWDSWVTVEFTEFVPRGLRMGPGFLGAIPPVIAGNALRWSIGGGWIHNQFADYDASEVPIAQFTIAEDASLHLEMHVFWTVNNGPLRVEAVRWSNGDEPIIQEVASCDRADVNGDGTVDLIDVLGLLSGWGDDSLPWRARGHVGNLRTEVHGCTFELPPVIDVRPTGRGSIHLVRTAEASAGSVAADYRVELSAGPDGATIEIAAGASVLAADGCSPESDPRGYAVFDTGYEVSFTDDTAWAWDATCSGGLQVRLVPVFPSGEVGAPIVGCTSTGGLFDSGRYRIQVLGEVAFDGGIVDPDASASVTMMFPDAPNPWRDVTDDGIIDITDLLTTLANWGPACPE